MLLYSYNIVKNIIRTLFPNSHKIVFHRSTIKENTSSKNTLTRSIIKWTLRVRLKMIIRSVFILSNMVLKIGLDRLVRLSAGHNSDSIWLIRPESDPIGIRLLESTVWSMNWTNRLVSFEPSNSFSFPFPHSPCSWYLHYLLERRPFGSTPRRWEPRPNPPLYPQRAEKSPPFPPLTPKTLQISSSPWQHPPNVGNPTPPPSSLPWAANLVSRQ